MVTLHHVKQNLVIKILAKEAFARKDGDLRRHTQPGVKGIDRLIGKDPMGSGRIGGEQRNEFAVVIALVIVGHSAFGTQDDQRNQQNNYR